MARRDDDDAPWLAEAAPARATRVSKRSLFWTVFTLVALAAVAAIGLFLLLTKKDGGSTQGYMNAEQAPLITAEPGPYKVAPIDPKGLAVEGQDQTIYAAGEGIDAGSVIDQSAMPEAVLPRPGSEPPPGAPTELLPEAAPMPVPAPMVAAPPVAAVVPKVVPKPQVAAKPQSLPTPEAAPKPIGLPPVKRPGSVQIGAFSSAEKAEAAWGALAGRHGLSGKRVIAVESGGKTLYRLRAASADTGATCARMKAAGDACAAVE